MKKALVLSGGGSNGAYQIGAWKALKKLGMKFDMVVGVSIGSMNGAAYAQNDYRKAKKLWLSLKTTDMFDLDEDIDGKINTYNMKKIFKYVLRGGITYERGAKHFGKVIKEEKVRKSKIVFGLGTYSLKNQLPKLVSINEIPRGKLIDYIFASCSVYPIITKKTIDDDDFIDGGFYDNLPINLAIDMGATEIVAIDLSTIGLVKRVKDKNIKIDLIKMKKRLKNPLIFNPKDAKELMQEGYFDVMKYFGAIDGDIYVLKKGSLDKNYNKIKTTYISLLKEILLSGPKKRIVTEIFNLSRFNKLFVDIRNDKEITKTVNDSMEYLGELFKIDPRKKYSSNYFNYLLLKEVKSLGYIKLSKGLKGRMLVGHMYNKYKNAKDKEEITKELFNLALIFPKDFLATIYLIAISKKHPLILKSDQFYNDILNLLKEKK